jgi:hypothetical protein
MKKFSVTTIPIMLASFQQFPVTTIRRTDCLGHTVRPCGCRGTKSSAQQFQKSRASIQLSPVRTNQWGRNLKMKLHRRFVSTLGTGRSNKSEREAVVALACFPSPIASKCMQPVRGLTPCWAYIYKTCALVRRDTVASSHGIIECSPRRPDAQLGGGSRGRVVAGDVVRSRLHAAVRRRQSSTIARRPLRPPQT